MNISNSKIWKLSFLIVTFFFTQQSIAQIPNGYYSNAEGKTGNELRSALHNIIKNHTVVSYSNLLNAYWATDNRGDGKVWDIYSDNPNGNPPYTFRLGQDVCGSYDSEGDCYNREHLWPQSWFDEKSPMKSDLFHVLPTDGYVNNRRSNYPFGEVGNATWTSRNGSKLGNCKVSGYSGTVFEPIDEYKGDVARAFFYMSTRYYGEDSGWSTTAMTNQADIKDWAMEMLLRWNESDPVSQKEIDRNNAIYEDFQHNRNPFIDHPEYARMIWDESWNGGTQYNITVSNCTHGSISSEANSAFEGQTITLAISPDSGYELDALTVYKTGSPSTTVSVSNNNTFTMPAFNVTVSATFKQNTTQYAISVSSTSHGSIAANATQALSGTSISLTATPESGYQLYAWYVYKTGNNNTTVEITNNSFTMPAFNVTVFATFVPQSIISGVYAKVTNDLTNWSGDYLIVCESENVAFNGGLTTLDAPNNTISVTISNNTIVANETTNAARFTIDPYSDGYSIKNASGKYIGNESDSNNLSVFDSPKENTISLAGGDADIICSKSHLRFNATPNQMRFRYYKSSTYTSQKAIQLYKKSSGATMMQHTLHFDSNGGQGTMNTIEINENEATNIPQNTFTRENHVFEGWNTEANGTGTFYSDGSQIVLYDEMTLYAQWLPQFSITCATDLAHGEISADKTKAIFEESVTLTAYPDDNYELSEWIVTDCSDNEISVTENLFEMPNCEVTISATFRPVEPPFVAEYHLVTSTDQLISGRKYLIVDANKTKALGEQKTNNRAAVSISCTDNIITDKANAYELTLGGSEGAWTLHDGNGYLYAASNSSNHLKTQNTIDGNSKWSISISENKANIVAQGSNSHNTIRYNNANTSNLLFSCYENGQNDICLFIKSENYDIQEDSELPSLTLFPFDRCTIRPDAKLTVSGTLINTNAENLIIKDGGQLIHNTANVAATVEKDIVGYSSEQDNFYFLASPVTSCDASCVKTGTYDMFTYDEPTHYWINQKNTNDNLSITTGYLYANDSDQSLLFSGTLLPSENDFTINSLSHQADVLNGFNLVGNPFVCQAYINQDFYILDNDKVILNETQDYPIKPCEAVFVKATEESHSVTFSKSIPLKNSNSINLSVSGNRSNDIDRIRIRFDEGCVMEKFTLKEDLAELYIPQDGNHFSVVSARSTVNEMPVSFKATKNGTYTITIKTENLNVDYLHLVDNLAGADVDLLDAVASASTAYYTFDAKTTDYPTRFKIVFNNTENSQNGNNFAFQSSNRLIIPNAKNESKIQIFDAIGRNIMTKPCHGSFNDEINLKSGIYTILLQSENDTQVQKIVWK